VKDWFIYYNGERIGMLLSDKADDEKDAVLNWADENLKAERG